MIIDLASDFRNAIVAMPREYPKRRTLELFEEAICRQIQCIDRYPTTVLQCMWNLCWWYDSLLHNLQTHTADMSRDIRYTSKLVECS